MPIEWEHLKVDITNIILSQIIDIFFRDVEARGSHQIPETGALFFVGAPHANQFLDPVVLNRHSGRRISYLCAKKSYDRPFIGFLSKCAGSIPVSRAQDYAVKGHGTVKIVEKYSNPLILNGVGTKFTEQVKAGTLISLDDLKCTAEVAEVISDTELRLKKEFSDSAVYDVSNKEGLKYTCIPHLDHSVVYQAVHETLNKDGCVGIFPEGGSHDRTELLPLKAGVAIMSLGAMAANPDLDVKIIPCGLNYFHPDRFRSRAVVDYGKPITIAREMVEQFKKGGTHKREAATKLMKIISEALKNVTLTAPDYETLKVIQAIRRLYRPPHRKLKISQVVELNRRLIEGYLHFQKDPRLEKVSNEVMKYNQKLEYFGIRDHQVQTTKMNRMRATFRFFRRVLFLLILTALALPGLVLNAPILVVAKIVSKKKQKEALATSTVKIAARDVIGSWKMLIALGLGPTLYSFYSLIAYWLFSDPSASFFSRISVPIVSLIVIPIISYMCLQFGERGLDIYRSLPPLFLTMVGNASIKDLQEIREQLSGEITKIVNELGPQLFPDLDSSRMIPNHGESPPSGAMTPTQSALNWLMTPFEMVSERLFSDAEDSSASVSRSSSHPNLAQLSPKGLHLSLPGAPNISLCQDSSNETVLTDSMVFVQPPSPEFEDESKKLK